MSSTKCADEENDGGTAVNCQDKEKKSRNREEGSNKPPPTKRSRVEETPASSSAPSSSQPLYKFEIYNAHAYEEGNNEDGATYFADVVIYLKGDQTLDTLGRTIINQLFEEYYGYDSGSMKVENRRVELGSEIHSLGLEAGKSKGVYKSKNCLFKFNLLSVSDEYDLEMEYPVIGDAELTISSEEKSDHLSDEEKALALRFQASLEKHSAPEWNEDRDTWAMMGMLLQARWSFAKSWKFILQYAVLNRTKGATANRFSTLMRKQYHLVEDIGKGLSNESRVIQAKRIGRDILLEYIEGGGRRKRPVRNFFFDPQI